MMYQHYDVQPVDRERVEAGPVRSDGSRTQVLGTRVRGHEGNLIMQLLAVQAWRAVEGRRRSNLKFVVEGEEESEADCLS